MNLVFDVGNSRCKWALAMSGAHVELISSGYYNRADTLALEFAHMEELSGGAPEKIMVASVSNEATCRNLMKALEKKWPRLSIQRFTSSGRAHGVSNGYSHPETLGADRWAAMIAVHAFMPGNSLIIDCGTAVTLDILDAQGKHFGGYILPGLRMMRDALHEGTAMLPLAEGQGLGLARTTHNAIAFGTLLTLVASIEKVATLQNRLYGGSLQLVMTGGDAELVGEHLSIHYRYEPDLVLKGLAIAVEANES